MSRCLHCQEKSGYHKVFCPEPPLQKGRDQEREIASLRTELVRVKAERDGLRDRLNRVGRLLGGEITSLSTLKEICHELTEFNIGEIGKEAANYAEQAALEEKKDEG